MHPCFHFINHQNTPLTENIDNWPGYEEKFLRPFRFIIIKIEYDVTNWLTIVIKLSMLSFCCKEISRVFEYQLSEFIRYPFRKCYLIWINPFYLKTFNSYVKRANQIQNLFSLRCIFLIFPDGKGTVTYII